MTRTEFPSAVAKARFVQVSPRKARRVIDLVRGRSVADALDILRWAPQAASEALPPASCLLFVFLRRAFVHPATLRLVSGTLSLMPRP